MRVVAMAGLTQPHTHSFALAGTWGLGERGGQPVTGVRRCHRLLCAVLVLRVEKPQWVQVLLELGHTTIHGEGNSHVVCCR